MWFAGQSCGVTMKAKWRSTGEVAQPACEVGKGSPFVKPLMLKNERSLPLKTSKLILLFVERVDTVRDRPAFPDDFPDYVALERVALTYWVFSKRFRLVVEYASVDAFTDIEGPTVWPAKDVDIEPSGIVPKKAVCIRTTTSENHRIAPTEPSSWIASGSLIRIMSQHPSVSVPITALGPPAAAANRDEKIRDAIPSGRAGCFGIE